MRYFNNAATSYPKAPEVIQAVAAALSDPPHNPYRDGGQGDDDSLVCRRLIAELFGCDSPERVVFTASATLGINMLLGGLKRDGGHLVTTCAEHNAVLRPVARMERLENVSCTRVDCGPLGQVSAEAILEALRPDTFAVVLAHTSNVTGWVQDIPGIYRVCSDRKVPLIVGCSAVFPVSGCCLFVKCLWGPWSLQATRGLGGPSGTGGFILGGELSPEPWFVGGTGIWSDLSEMPASLPLRYEAGVPNHIGISGLAAACRSLSSYGPVRAASHLRGLVSRLSDALHGCRGLAWFSAADNPSGIVSFNLAGWSPRDLGYVLEQSFGFAVRSGLHCAPRIHSAMGTFPDGTVRVSFSRFTTDEDVDVLAQAILQLGEAACE